MSFNVNIIFKDGTIATFTEIKHDRLMLRLNDELTLDTVGFGLYRRQDNVILGKCIDDEVYSKHIHILPA